MYSYHITGHFIRIVLLHRVSGCPLEGMNKKNILTVGSLNKSLLVDSFKDLSIFVRKWSNVALAYMNPQYFPPLAGIHQH